jgi:hypothetical protein
MSIPLQVRTRNKLLVGLDYGTTFSGMELFRGAENRLTPKGISFVLTNAADFKDIKPWHAWPGGPSTNNEYSQKVPSRIAYAAENDELSRDVWGYEVEPGLCSYSWTKLLLDRSALTTEYDDPDLKMAAANGLMRLPPGKTAQDVVTDYLRGMCKMFQGALRDTGLLQGGELELPMPIEFWLTVPATWTEEAKVAVLSAAKAAGFGSRPGDEINLIPEPEAAAHIAFKDGIHHVNGFVREGKGALVCDCGGGTVVSQLSPQS